MQSTTSKQIFDWFAMHRTTLVFNHEQENFKLFKLPSSDIFADRPEFLMLSQWVECKRNVLGQRETKQCTTQMCNVNVNICKVGTMRFAKYVDRSGAQGCARPGEERASGGALPVIGGAIEVSNERQSTVRLSVVWIAWIASYASYAANACRPMERLSAQTSDLFSLSVRASLQSGLQSLSSCELLSKWRIKCYHCQHISHRLINR